MNLPKECTVREIANFFGKSESMVYRGFKRAGIKHVGAIKTGATKGGKRTKTFHYGDALKVFTVREENKKQSVKKYRKYDCVAYLKCLDIAARGPNRETWPGMDCLKCQKYKKKMSG